MKSPKGPEAEEETKIDRRAFIAGALGLGALAATGCRLEPAAADYKPPKADTRETLENTAERRITLDQLPPNHDDFYLLLVRAPEVGDLSTPAARAAVPYERRFDAMVGEIAQAVGYDAPHYANAAVMQYGFDGWVTTGCDRISSKDDKASQCRASYPIAGMQDRYKGYKIDVIKIPGTNNANALGRFGAANTWFADNIQGEESPENPVTGALELLKRAGFIDPDKVKGVTTTELQELADDETHGLGLRRLFQRFGQFLEHLGGGGKIISGDPINHSGTVADEADNHIAIEPGHDLILPDELEAGMKGRYVGTLQF